MAESSLDDFFARKDKRQKKSKSKMTPNDVLAKADEPKKVKKKKDKEQPGGLGLTSGEEQSAKQQAEDDEWVDFQEQKEIDYTGLRIQTLQVRQDDDRDTGESEGEGEGGEGDGTKDGVSGPWNASAGQPSAAFTQAAAAPASPVTSEPEEKDTSSQPKKYIPPAQRAAALNPSSQVPRHKQSKKNAPNIQSEEDFPTLGGGPPAPAGSAWGAKKYESSVASDIDTNPAQRRGVNLSLENKYAALQE